MALLKLSEEQLTRLGNRIDDGWSGAKGSHSERMDRCKLAYRRFRNMLDAPSAGDARKSNVRVPLVQWQVLAELAAEAGALFGDDAEVVALPTGATDQKLVKKVARFVDWRVFHSMRALNPFLEFIFRKITYGRSFALSPWKVEEYTVLDDDGNRKKAIWYDGPDFIPLWPDELIVPAERVRSIHEFSWVIVRSRATWDELLRGEMAGRYADVRKNIARIKGHAQSGTETAAQGDEVRQEADTASGVNCQNAGESRGSLEVWTWYGHSEPDEATGEKDEWAVTYLPDVKLVIGVQDLAEIYPRAKNRRPIVESAMLPTGDYWGMGFAELLEVWEDELTANENLFTDAAEFSVGPVIFAKPALAEQIRRQRYEPFTVIPTDDPNGVKVVQPQVNPAGYQIKNQNTLAIVERLTGRSDQAMGRSIDRPNAPRTLGGQQLLLQEGNVRVGLNMTVLREDMGAILSHIWELECQFAGEGGVFFRVTEEEAGGLFPVENGGSVMEQRDFAGRYDFDIRFATSNWDRMAKKQDAMVLFQSAVQNPIIATNPKALWAVTNKLYQAFGDDHFADIVPEPPDLGTPKKPKDEWVLCVQGEEISVNPLDDDDAHMMEHDRQLEKAAKQVAAVEPISKDAIRAMITHVVDHKAQKRQKMILQAITQNIQGEIQASAGQELAGMLGAPQMPQEQQQEQPGPAGVEQ